jgi:hypothetical protein
MYLTLKLELKVDAQVQQLNQHIQQLTQEAERIGDDHPPLVIGRLCFTAKTKGKFRILSRKLIAYNKSCHNSLNKLC